MSEVQVIFVDQPSVGMRTRICLSGKEGLTSVVRSVARHHVRPDWLIVQTQSGSTYVGPLRQQAATATPPPPRTPPRSARPYTSRPLKYSAAKLGLALCFGLLLLGGLIWRHLSPPSPRSPFDQWQAQIKREFPGCIKHMAFKRMSVQYGTPIIRGGNSQPAVPGPKTFLDDWVTLVVEVGDPWFGLSPQQKRHFRSHILYAFSEWYRVHGPRVHGSGDPYMRDIDVTYDGRRVD